jgi:hypothetical protein
MTTTTTHRIAIDRDGLGARWNCHDCRRRGGYELGTAGAVWTAKEHLWMTHRIRHRTDPAEIELATLITAEGLLTPSKAGEVVAELDRIGLLVGGFPPGDTTPVDKFISVVRWRSPKTPDGCYTTADYERAARALAEALDAAGLLVKPLAN